MSTPTRSHVQHLDTATPPPAFSLPGKISLTWPAGLSAHNALDAAFALSGPDGGICGHEPPLFRLPASPTNHPGTGGDAFTFTKGEPAQFLEARGPFTLGLSTSGGFSAVFMLRLRAFPAAGTRMQLFMLRGGGGLQLEASILPSEEAVPTSTRPRFAYTFGATTYESTGVITVVPGVLFMLAFRYKHADSTMEIYVDGVPQGNAGTAVRHSLHLHALPHLQHGYTSLNGARTITC